MGGAVFETSSLEALRAFNELQRCASGTQPRNLAAPPAPLPSCQRPWRREFRAEYTCELTCAPRRDSPLLSFLHRLEKAGDTLTSPLANAAQAAKFRR